MHSTTPLSSTSPTAPGSTAAAPALALRDVSKRYGAGSTAVTALDRVDLEIAPGTLTAVMGPSGSGKSTLLHLAAGLDAPSAGDVVIGGTSVVGLDDDALTALRREQVGVVFQSFNLVPSLTARENVELPALLAGRAPDRARIAGLLDELGVGGLGGRRPHELSGGQQQRFAIARALAQRPAIVLADEPTGALDSATSIEVQEILVRQAAAGQAIVVVTHDPVVASRAERIVLLRDGRVEDDLPATDAATIAQRMLVAAAR
ncbi:ABC transporter ATP-binding protein [Agrococcus baldri]|uniref:ABC transporter ATP-binding protein n=1 Tax=Agrococcus baldri TaxID=153730 RepID=A0AA87UQ47_9MICO|nr:ABC transporter ATP-binding protein [Agrococcus baldri]GEK78661.1 ABC transporter ATP-binding protein [Agrococcus baldri]